MVKSSPKKNRKVSKSKKKAKQSRKDSQVWKLNIVRIFRWILIILLCVMMLYALVFLHDRYSKNQSKEKYIPDLSNPLKP